jgi:hypothetical protein
VSNVKAPTVSVSTASAELEITNAATEAASASGSFIVKAPL